MTELHDEGIEAIKKPQADGRYSIEVERHGLVGALRILEDSRLLTEEKESKATGETFGASREDRRFRYERSVSGELEATLERIPGIREARVHLNIPPVDSLFNRGGELSPPSASVLVVTAPKADVDREALARLIGGAAGLGAPRVTVIVQAAPLSSERGLGIGGIEEGSKNPIPAWLEVSVNEVSRRWILVMGLFVFGGGLIAFGVRTPKRAGHVVARQGA